MEMAESVARPASRNLYTSQFPKEELFRLKARRFEMSIDCPC